MITNQWRALAIALVVCCSVTWVWTADRVWQTGTWRDTQTSRPKVVFGVSPNNPNNGTPRTAPPAAKEVRTYVIETETLRLELKENTTVDVPHIEVLIGEPVSFAMEKNTVYIKDELGREHKLSLTKKTTLPTK